MEAYAAVAVPQQGIVFEQLMERPLHVSSFADGEEKKKTKHRHRAAAAAAAWYEVAPEQVRHCFAAARTKAGLPPCDPFATPTLAAEALARWVTAWLFDMVNRTDIPLSSTTNLIFTDHINGGGSCHTAQWRMQRQEHRASMERPMPDCAWVTLHVELHELDMQLNLRVSNLSLQQGYQLEQELLKLAGTPLMPPHRCTFSV
jgi:hypothetical protein